MFDRNKSISQGSTWCSEFSGDNSEERSIKRKEGVGETYETHNKLREDAVAVMRPNLAVDKSSTELHSLTQMMKC